MRCGQRGGGKRKGELRHSSGAQAGQFQGGGVGGEKDLLRANFFVMDAATEVAANVQPGRIREVHRANLGILHDLSPGVFRSARQAGEHFAWINGASGYQADDFEIAGIAPRNR